jgi:serine/threonine protein kinase
MKIDLKGYQITELLYDGNRTLVYRGVKKDEGKSVVIKTLHREYPNFNELLQFRHQYVLTKNLSIPGIVKPISLEKNGNGYVLIMEDVGGISLSEYLRDCNPLAEKIPLKNANLFCHLSAATRGKNQGEIKIEEKTKNLWLSWENYEENVYPLDEFFLVGLTLVEILENLHQKRIIHKDIKPANILINPETKEIFLIDFSIASLLPKETQELQNPNQLEGTLAYISPEQTGRMNRGIDYRSDFYSLGVTFYELLTGKLPFRSEDPMELVHSQIAKIAEPPHLVKADIPQASRPTRCR